MYRERVNHVWYDRDGFLCGKGQSVSTWLNVPVMRMTFLVGIEPAK